MRGGVTVDLAAYDFQVVAISHSFLCCVFSDLFPLQSRDQWCVWLKFQFGFGLHSYRKTFFALVDPGGQGESAQHGNIELRKPAYQFSNNQGEFLMRLCRELRQFAGSPSPGLGALSTSERGGSSLTKQQGCDFFWHAGSAAERPCTSGRCGPLRDDSSQSSGLLHLSNHWKSSQRVVFIVCTSYQPSVTYSERVMDCPPFCFLSSNIRSSVTEEIAPSFDDLAECFEAIKGRGRIQHL